jgi:predicted transcriptional regulator
METTLETTQAAAVEADEGSRLKFRFDPFTEGPSKVFGPLEAAIMEVVWQHAPTTVGQVHQALLSSRDLAYTTVMTTMHRLADKGWLDRDSSTVAYTYAPVLSKSELAEYVVETVAEALIDEYGGLLSQFIAQG